MIVIYCSTFGLRYFLGIGSTTKVVRVPWICASKGTRTDCGGSSDLAVDTDAEPQPVVSGYIEFAGEIVKIRSVEDIERVLEKLRG